MAPLRIRPAMLPVALPACFVHRREIGTDAFMCIFGNAMHILYS